MKKEISLLTALIPILFLVVMLFFNVKLVYGDDALSGSNQFVLILGAAVATIVGFFNGVSYKDIMKEVSKNIKSTSSAILILLLVGSLAGSWILGGIVPAMIYYGLQILDPSYFLVATIIISAIVSISTGSSWTTSATIGIALIGIGGSMGIYPGMTAGAVISGAYFGDKMSPLSDTTNLAPAMAGADLFDHISYMAYTTIPTILITLTVFGIIGFNLDVNSDANINEISNALKSTFNITPWLFLVPIIVVGLILKKMPPVAALLIGCFLGLISAFFMQPDLMVSIAKAKGLVNPENLNFVNTYRVLMDTLTTDTNYSTGNEQLNELLASGGMAGMLNTIWLIICAMCFGGAMEAIGALSKLSSSLLKLFKGTFGLFASTMASCLTINITTSDQYLSIVVPGKMFAKAYEEKGLAPENLSRTLEDSGTVTSVLIPWNTCGAYQAGVLGVSVSDYFIYAMFNYLSPFMTLLFAAFRIKIRMLKK